MDEVAGALERPGGSRIELSELKGEFTVHVPRPRMPLLLYAALSLTACSLVLVFVIGFFVFVLQRPFPGYTELVDIQFHRLPTLWLVFGLVGWIVLFTAGVVTLLAAVRPLTRREELTLTSSGISIQTYDLGMTRNRRYAIRDVGEFRDRKDPQGLRESQLVLLLNRPSAQPGGDETEIASSTSEAEKQWLASVLNVVLKRLKR